MRICVRRCALVGVGALALAGCSTGEAAEDTPRLLTVAATRGDLLIRAEATGAVEPVREVEVKSKASGEILRLHVDVGDQVERGTLLAEIDPRDVRNRYNQVQADLEVAQARLEISEAQLERSRALYEAEVITQQEFESATLDYANARANLVRAQTDFELAELQLADVSIRAPMGGTIIQKNVEEGTVIQSASSNVSGGTALFVMADLGSMQVRTLVDETDMGELRAGMETAVRVEAYPDRTFRGLVEKIEPLAQVEQNVTMFPVIVSLDNRSGLLKPGMNAEVEVFIDEAFDVVLVPNNAIVQTSDVGPAAMALGLDVNELNLTEFIRAERGGSARGGRGGASEGEPAQGAEGAGRRGTGRRAGANAGDPGSTQSVPSEEAEARIQALRAQVEAGEISQDSMRAVMRSLVGQAGFGRGAFGRSEGNGTPTRETRPAAVFVMGADSVPEPRLVQLGLGDWDNTRVVSGVEPGETLVIVGAAQLQAQQQEFLDRMRGRMGGSPFGGGAPGRGGRGR
jgi:HlyD family secretion protein